MAVRTQWTTFVYLYSCARLREASTAILSEAEELAMAADAATAESSRPAAAFAQQVIWRWHIRGASSLPAKTSNRLTVDKKANTHEEIGQDVKCVPSSRQ